MRIAPARALAALEEALSQLPRAASGMALAVSGGRDSMVLLHLLATSAQSRLPMRVLHVDHGLQPAAVEWSRRCAAAAAAFALPCDTLRVDGRPAPGQSPEAAARVARYAALGNALRRDEALLTAHHADDQLETVLLQLMRGGGARTLTGMPVAAALGSGWHLRPLLGFTRDELAAHAATLGLEWSEDPSNADLRFDRNYLRARVLPPLRERWPAAARTVGRVARLAAETVALADAVADAELRALLHGRALRHAEWAARPRASRRAALRAWLDRLGLPRPTEGQMLALERDLAHAAPDRVPMCAWAGVQLYRYRGHLHAQAPGPAPPTQALAWDGQGELAWPGGGVLSLRPTCRGGLAPGGPLHWQVRAREGGERFAPREGPPRALQKWLQEQGVLPWQRPVLPLIWAGGELVAVADLACAASHRAAPGEPGLEVVWQGAPVVSERQAFDYTIVPS